MVPFAKVEGWEEAWWCADGAGWEEEAPGLGGPCRVKVPAVMLAEGPRGGRSTSKAQKRDVAGGDEWDIVSSQSI